MRSPSAFFQKLAAYQGIPEVGGLRQRASLLSRASARAAASAWRVWRFDRPPIVLGGCGRSGTTLLLSVLSSHPNICSIPIETLALCPSGYAEQPDLAEPLQLGKLYRVLLLSAVGPDHRRWCEKTPRNVLFFGRILEHFGTEVRLIHIVRDGRDVITSRHPESQAAAWVSPERWIRDVEAGLRYEGHPQLLTLRYEDLILDYDATITRVCRFLDEKVHPAMRHWHETASVRENPAWSGGIQPLHRKGIGRWRQPRHAERVGLLLEQPAAVALLRRLGYLDEGVA